jgi:PEP-CTERM motif
MRKQVVAMLLFGVAVCARAGIVTYTSEPLFQSQGAILQNTNWDSFTGAVFNPGNPYTIGGVTYTSGRQTIVGPAFGYGNAQPVLVSEFWSPLPGTISTSPDTFDMFGFNIGLLGSTSLVDIQLGTNLGSYSFLGLSFPNVAAGLAFQGFITDNPAEYFTSFILTSQGGSGSAPAITDVQLGQAGETQTIPEPSTLSLLACGVLGLALRCRVRPARRTLR